MDTTATTITGTAAVRPDDRAALASDAGDLLAASRRVEAGAASSPTIRRVTAAIGAEVEGIDLRRPDRRAVQALREALDEHEVLFVRDQHLTVEEHRRLASAFGPLLVHPVTRMRGGSDPMSEIVDTADRPPAAFPWHTDLSWLPDPPSVGFLRAVEIPGYGGDTLWASGSAMFDRLPPELARRCVELKVVHRIDETLLRSIRASHGPTFAAQVAAAHPAVCHPLVRVHPRTGRHVLWLSPMYTTAIAAMGAAASAAFLDDLHRRIDAPEVQVRWRWQPGDVVIWDEAATVHRALGDHHPQRRVMRRCAVAGGPPVGAPAATEAS